MAIFNTNEFLRKTFSKTIFGTAARQNKRTLAKQPRVAAL